MNDSFVRCLIGKIHNDTLILTREIFHIRCDAHILNLIVKNDLHVIDSSMEKIHDSIAYWTSNIKKSEDI